MTTPAIDLRLGDCHDLIQDLPDNSIDLLLSDPPYGCTAARWDELLDYGRLWPEYRRVMRPGGAILIFSSQPFTSMLVASNVREYRHSWYWQKTTPTFHLRCKTQQIEAKATKRVAASRMGRVSLTAWLDPETVKLTKIAALTSEKTLQDFIHYALHEAIEKAGVK